MNRPTTLRLAGTNPAGLSAMPQEPWTARLAALLSLVNGLLALGVPTVMRLPRRPSLLGDALPFGLHQTSRPLSAAFGMVLVYLAYHLLRRRHVAWWLAVAAASAALVAHLLKLGTAPLALGPALLLLLLWSSRRQFTVRSEPWSVAQGIGLAIGVAVLTLAYGVLGFEYLDRRDFGIDFAFREALRHTLRQMLLLGNPDLHAGTRYASWFLHSLDAATFAGASLIAFTLALPIRYRHRTLPHERAEVRALLEEHGGTSLDVFKTWPDKAYLFDRSRRGVIAYSVSAGCAVALGSPIGEPAAAEAALDDFLALCGDNGWLPAFHQVTPSMLPVFRARGLEALKVGEEASVDLGRFASETANTKWFRYLRRRFEREGYALERVEPPLSPHLVEELEAISDAWLTIPGRRERGFTLGQWGREYIRTSPVYVVRGRDGVATAFANVVPSYREGEATVDLMRHRPDVVNGTMDFLFTAMMLDLHERGFRWFSEGLAPFAGVGESPDSSIEERAVHELFERLNRLFSYRGLRAYKEKFEPEWEGRFLIYKDGPIGLARISFALTRLTADR
ncbi:MAG: DUF2156 domain-containing protein [Dehalococcoidia bacterium]|nr:MAG: DUF2156 domain-containing protein [Dehalococcoidia bacterium]